MLGEDSNSKLPSTQWRSNVLTVEGVLWLAIASIAVVIRLADLGSAPLNSDEAQEALRAWDAARGYPLPPSGYSPLLVSINALVFALFGASDAAARFAPAVCGVALALSPLLFRRYIGRLGSLIAGFYLAFSPSALTAARHLDANVFAVAGAILALGAWLSFRADGRCVWLTVAAVATAIVLASGAAGWGVFLSLALSAAVVVLIWPDLVPRARWGGIRQYGVVLVLTLLAAITGLGFNPPGLGAFGASLLVWFARFRSTDPAVISPLALVALYEPLVLTFGLGAAIWAFRRRHRLGVHLVLWVCIQIVLLAAMPGRRPADTLGIVPPLALLTGLSTRELFRSAAFTRMWRVVSLYILAVLVLWAYVYLVLLHYAVSADVNILLLAVLAGLTQLLLALLLSYAIGTEAAFTGLAAAVGVVLLTYTFSAAWSVAYARASDPREPLLGQPAAVEVRDLQQTLREISWVQTGMPTGLSVGVKASVPPLLAWHLREFETVEWNGSETERPAVFVTVEGDLPPDTDYVGQDFVLVRTWQPQSVACRLTWPLHCEAMVRWLLIRHTLVLPEATQHAVLWVRPDLFDQ